MNSWPPPTADQQIEFLAKVQRIFTEGEFTATYKFALLIALSDLAVELGRDTGEPLSLDMKQIAEEFIELYWPMRRPYQSGLPGSRSDILAQNKGTQAAVLNQIARFADGTNQTLPRAKQTLTWPNVLSEVARVIRDPINVDGVGRVGATPAPEMGEHTDEVLSELGYSAAEIEDWREAGVV